MKDKVKVLYIEDDKYFARDYSEKLIDIGFEVTTVSSAKKALKSIESCLFDLCILDIRLDNKGAFSSYESVCGSKTGKLLARKIKDEFPDIKIIAFTYCDAPDIIEWFEQDDCFFYINKRDMSENEFAQNVKSFVEGIELPIESKPHPKYDKTLCEISEIVKLIKQNQDITSRDIDLLINLSGHRSQVSEKNLNEIKLGINSLVNLLYDSSKKDKKRESWNIYLAHARNISDALVVEILMSIAKLVFTLLP